jgi:RNA polymerase sigma-70 factor (ECF subfamily)
MRVTSQRPVGVDEARFLEVARSGDSGGFAVLTERYRRELHVHCYRMLASFEDAQDLTQEAFLRAWSGRATFEGRSSLRTWLYRIATNACLDFLERRPDRVPVPSSTQDGAAAEVGYLQPYPDHLLDEVPAAGEEPGEVVVAKETIELAFLVAVQHLPPRQRAVLVLRDVLGWPAGETAATLGISVASANSALQRARATMRQHLPARRTEWSSSTHGLTDEERGMLQRYVDAHTQGDVEGLAALLRADLRFAMPPEPGSWVGRDVIVQVWVAGGFGSVSLGEWRCMPTLVNRQPAVACYLRRPGDTQFRALAVDVLRIEDGLVAEITAFPLDNCGWLQLPPTLDDPNTDPQPPTLGGAAGRTRG